MMPDSATFLRLQERLQAAVGRAIGDYRMIDDGDTVLVCMSGGKDSHVLLDILIALQQRAPGSFRLIAVNVDQKQPGFPEHILPAYLASRGVEYRIVEADTYSLVREKIPLGKTTCSLCSRLRRGIIYRTAKELGAGKIALGHHRDDMIETLFLNMFYGSRLKAMPPKLVTDDGQHGVIRPLAYCSEKDIASYARHREFPIIPCDLCGSQENLKRREIKEMLRNWERSHPGRVDNIFSALQNVTASHLADRSLFDFERLAPGQHAHAVDTLFDPPEEIPAGRRGMGAGSGGDSGALRLASMEGTRIRFVRNTGDAPGKMTGARNPADAP